MADKIEEAKKTGFGTADGVVLYERRWLPEENAKAVLLIVHGYAEHIGRYAQVARYLTDQRYAVYGFDLRGHGRSPGKRALIRSFEGYLDDVAHFLKRIRNEEAKKPIFILGHSLGGTIVALFAIIRQPDVKGIILSAPFLKVPDTLSGLKRCLISIAGRLVPELPLPDRIESAALSRDPDVVTAYESDPRVYHGPICSGTAAQVNYVICSIQKKAQEISLPFLIVHGTGDRIADIEGSRRLYAAAKSPDKTMKEYKAFYHEVLNEPGKEAVLADICSWMDHRLHAR